MIYRYLSLGLLLAVACTNTPKQDSTGSFETLEEESEIAHSNSGEERLKEESFTPISLCELAEEIKIDTVGALLMRDYAHGIEEGMLSPCDDDITFAIADSALSDDAEIRSTYGPAFKVILHEADGALAEAAGSWALQYLKAYPADFLAFYENCSSRECSEELERVAGLIEFELSWMDDPYGEELNFISQLEASIKNERKSLKAKAAELIGALPSTNRGEGLTGMIFEMGAEHHLLSDRCEFMFECDCCASNLILHEDTTFSMAAYCTSSEDLYTGFFSIENEELTLHFNPIHVRKTYYEGVDVEKPEDFSEIPCELGPFSYSIEYCAGKVYLNPSGNSEQEIAIETNSTFRDLHQIFEAHYTH